MTSQGWCELFILQPLWNQAHNAWKRRGAVNGEADRTNGAPQAGMLTKMQQWCSKVEAQLGVCRRFGVFLGVPKQG